MIKKLKYKDILTLSFMIFALFVGAGNIIFPPIVGLKSGQYFWYSALGFLITAVLLPVVTLVAMLRFDGSIENISNLIGKKLGLFLSTVCYIMVGPLFAIPRTSTVSFTMGFIPFFGEKNIILFIYSVIYFLLVIYISLYPQRLINVIENVLAPIKVISLALLSSIALIYSTDHSTSNTINLVDKSSSMMMGLINGYLTIDSLGAMIFSIVVVHAMYSKGMKKSKLLNDYNAIISVLIACISLILLYLSLFKLGADSRVLIPYAKNGAEILQTYIGHHFGKFGSIFLTLLITVSCLVTAMGLTCSCAGFFAKHLKLNYKIIVIIIGSFSILVSNLGLNSLISFSTPVLTIIHPPCIIMILASFTYKLWKSHISIFLPTIITSFIFSCFDVIKIMNYNIDCFNNMLNFLPLSSYGLSWLLPTLLVFIVLSIYDFFYRKKNEPK